MPRPYNYTDPDWTPLERAVSLAELPKRTCGEFMWMCEEPQGVHQYKHYDTRNYVHLTADTPQEECLGKIEQARCAKGVLNG